MMRDLFWSVDKVCPLTNLRIYVNFYYLMVNIRLSTSNSQVFIASK